MVYGRSIAIGGCILVVVLVLSIFIFILSMGPCPRGTFACDGGKLCVPQRQICDNRKDCLDGEDEHPVECGLLYGSKEMTDKIVGKQKLKQQKQEDENADNNKTYFYNKFSNKNTTLKPFSKCELSSYPDLCNCTQRTILYCGRRAKLTQIPQIDAEVTFLIIKRNNLTLQKSAFKTLTKLQRLTLKNNNISQIVLGTFDGLQQLESLDIRHNNLSQINKGIFNGLNSLQWLFLISNQIEKLPLQAVFIDVPKLEWLMLSENLLTLRHQTFPHMKRLYEIYLDFNRITYVAQQTFSKLDNLQLLNLNGNQIAHIDALAFQGLRNIRDIRLMGNPIKQLADNTFQCNNFLEALTLSHTMLQIHSNLLEPLTNVSFLNLTGLPFDHIDFKAIGEMLNLKYVIYDRFYYCSMTPHVRMCKPNTDGVSSYQDLLSKPVLRYSAWIMATITVTGNIMVLVGRFVYARDENKTVTIVIRNLALADMLMGFYLLTIGTQDYRYRGAYYKVAWDWITSWQCAAVGVMAVTSSEVSMLILAFMSLERFLLIADPFRGHHRMSMRNIAIALIIIWIIGLGIAVAPVILWRSSTKFYGTYSGTCFPLHIQEPYPLGWEYSAFIFLGVNLILLVMIAVLYTALLFSIWRTRKATPLSLLDCEFAVRFFFIVLTDMLCWAPIIVIKIWVFYNYNISDDIYAWLVVFILPLNSAVNPLLYTFTTPKYRNQVIMRGWKKITALKRPEPSNGITTTGMATATSSNPEDSTSKAIPMVSCH